MKNDFLDFVSSSARPPERLGRSICEGVQQSLGQEKRHSYAKFALSLTLASAASLILCPQFGIGRETALYHFGHHLMHSVGPWACAMYCAFLFTGVAALFVSLIMRPTEILLLGKRTIIFFTLLCVGGFGLFMAANALGVTNLNLVSGQGISYNLVWFISAVLLGHIFFQVGATLKLWAFRILTR